ncbi:MAG: redoxin domain-containing protein [Timaviella obliquedivisa GSE-PSE-MK23-08B]|nr:redoxin domain-containing protein [Timaviella obliquedivisa GSE-PSE-MK23-08B]
MLTVNQLSFKQEVLASSTPVLVNFWAPWCGVCKLVSPMLSEVQSAWGKQLKIVDINADENLRLSSSYQLTTLPTVLLFDRGSLLYRVDKLSNRNDFQKAANELHRTLEVLSISEYSYSA